MGGSSLNYNYWSDLDLDLLERYYPIGGSSYVRLKGVCKNEETIEIEAVKRCIKRYTEDDYGSNGWGIDDTDILIKHYIVGGYTLCKEKGLSKSKISTMARADQLKLKRFSNFEIEVAIDGDLSLEEKYELIGNNRTLFEIQSVAEYGEI